MGAERTIDGNRPIQIQPQWSPWTENRTSSRLTGTPIDIRCSLRVRDRVQSSAFNIGGVHNWTYASRLGKSVYANFHLITHLDSVVRICARPPTCRRGSWVRYSEFDASKGERIDLSCARRSGGEGKG